MYISPKENARRKAQHQLDVLKNVAKSISKKLDGLNLNSSRAIELQKNLLQVNLDIQFLKKSPWNAMRY